MKHTEAASPVRGGITRRQALEAALGSAALYALPLRTVAAAQIAVTRVTDEIALISGAGGNVLAATTSDGLVVVDSGTAASADMLLSTLGELPGGERIHTLFNSHWHLEQVGGNAVFGRANARIVAHEKTRLHLSTDYYLPEEARYEKALPPEAWPVEAFYTRGETTIGGTPIEYGYLLEAHTDGDIYVYFREANVIAVGDAVSPERDPVLDWFGGGWLGGRVDALALLLSITDENTRFVPSYGPVIGRAAVQAEHDVMSVFFDRMVEHVRKGETAEDIFELGVMNDLGRTFADPLKLVHDAHKGLWAHHNTLSPDVV